MKVLDLFEKFTGTIDVYDNYAEELGIAYCGNRLTKDGLTYFAKALQLPIESFNNEVVIVDVVGEDDDEDEIEYKLDLARQLFESAAGYCSDSTYRKLFVD